MVLTEKAKIEEGLLIERRKPKGAFRAGDAGGGIADEAVCGAAEYPGPGVVRRGSQCAIEQSQS